MGSNLDPTRATWRKSSYSGSSGGDCVEVAGLDLDLAPRIGVRDSKTPGSGSLTLSRTAWSAFLPYAAGAVAGRR